MNNATFDGFIFDNVIEKRRYKAWKERWYQVIQEEVKMAAVLFKICTVFVVFVVRVLE